MDNESTYSMLTRLNALAKKPQHQVDFSRNIEQETPKLSPAVPMPDLEEAKKMEHVLKNMLGNPHSDKLVKRS